MRLSQRILVLDGHSNQALACVRSLGRSGHTVLVASPRRWSLGAWSRFCRGQFQMEGETIEAFAALREWAQAEGANIILPLTERSCLLCNAERQKWEALGITIGCAPDELLMGAFDKAQTLRLAMACGVRIPSTRFPASLAECHRAAAEVGYPCVIKPRFSNAWNGSSFLPGSISYASNSDYLEAAVMARKQGEYWPLIQEFVAGQGKGAFALYDHGRAVTWFAHESLRDVRPFASPSCLRRSIELDGRLREPAESLLAALQWHGPAMVEFRDDGINPPCLMEVNGRFWHSLQLAVAAGSDFPCLWVRVLNGEVVEASNYDTGVTLRWLWGDVKHLLHILAGAPPGYMASPKIWQEIRKLVGSQPAGTRLEMWQASDPGPALGEWVEGVREILARRTQRQRA